MTNKEIVKKFLEGFNDKTKIEASLACLADDYRFKDPMVEHHSKQEFLKTAQEIGSLLEGVHIHRLAEDGDWVGVFYEFIIAGKSHRASEWFRLEDGMIKESTLMYDPTPIRALML